MKYDILHDLPGRMRVHCRNLYLDPSSRLELNRWVSHHNELVSARLSTRTGNLLIHYSRSASRETILVLLEDLQIFGVAKVARYDDGRENSLSSVVVAACGKEAAALVIKQFIPEPIRQVMAGWKMASRLMRLFQLLADGKIGDFLYGAARFAAFALFGKYLSVRFALTIVGAALAPSTRSVEAIDTDCPGYGRQNLLPPAPSSATDDAAIPFSGRELPFSDFSGRCACP